ncbi:MAG: J domain-containing protein [Clostridia bacterium]
MIYFLTYFGFKNNDSTINEPKQKPIKGKDILSNINISLEEGLVGTEKKLAINGYRGGIKTFSVNVPVGIKNKDKIRLASLGFPGKYGGKNGDLIITVNLIENKEFKLDGINLVKEITITPSKAVLGTSYKVNIFNETIFIPLPKYIKNNEIISYKNYGYINEEGIRGDLNLKVTIDLPDNITEREENLYAQLYKIENKRK